jgi:hypothetical protein
MNRVTLILDPLDPSSWKTTEDVEDVCAFLKKRLGKWPESAHLYHNYVAQSSDVTPYDEAGIARLQELHGHFFAIVYPEGPLLILVIVAIAVAAVAIVLSFLLRPKQKNQHESSPTNELSSRQNRERPLERIPDIYGTLWATPDLIAVPYRIFINNKEVEYAYMCLGRGEFTIYEVRDDTTPVSQIDGESVEVYPPNNSPNSLVPAPQLTIGSAIGTKVFNVRHSNNVNGQILRAPNAARFQGKDNVYYEYPDAVKVTGGAGIDLTNYFSAGVVGDDHYLVITNSSAHDPSRLIDAVQLNGTYLIVSVTSDTIVLSTPAAVNANWNTVNTFGGHVSRNDSPTLVQQGENWSEPVIVDDLSADQVWLNFVCPNGCYFMDSEGNQYAVGIDLEIELTQVNSAYAPIGSPGYFDAHIFGSSIDRAMIGVTKKITLPKKGSFRIRCRRASNTDLQKGHQVSDQIQWRDLYTASEVTTEDFGNVTTVQVVTRPTQDALAIKERKLNMLVARNLLQPNDYGTTIDGDIDRSGWIGGADGPWPGPVSFPADDPAKFLDGNPSTSWSSPFSIIIYPSDDWPHHVQVDMVTPRVFNYVKFLCDGGFGLRASNWNLYSSDDGIVWTNIWNDLIQNSNADPGGLLTFVFPTVRARFVKVEGIASVAAGPANPYHALSCAELNVGYDHTLPGSANPFLGTPAPTNNVADIFVAMALDPFIGRRVLAELDVTEIYAQAQAVIDYFGTVKCAEFCHSFDDSQTSFEEMANDLGFACFVTPYRRGNVLSLFFEKLTTNSVLLFNHRNKVPDSEVRTVTFGGPTENDGIELTYVEPNAPNAPDVDTPYTVYFPPGGTAKAPKKVTASGVRNYIQAYMLGWRLYNKLLYQNTAVQFDGLQESSLLILNERILVADNTRSDTQDGEIVDQAALLLTLSQPVVFVGGRTYTIFLQHYDMTVEAIGITAGPLDNQVILAGAAALPLVIDPGKYARTVYHIVSDAPTRSAAFLLSEKTPKEGQVYDIKAVNYDERYYEHDTDFLDNLVDVFPVFSYGSGYNSGDITGSGGSTGTSTPPVDSTTGSSTAMYILAIADAPNGSRVTFGLDRSVKFIMVFQDGQKINDGNVTLTGSSFTLDYAPDASAHLEAIGWG